jgi:hypothetical protein
MPKETHKTSPASGAFGSRLAKYAFVQDNSTKKAGSTSRPPPRSPQIQQRDDGHATAGPSSTGRSPINQMSASRSRDEGDVSSPASKKPKKVPRPYAGPEVYAHLSNTPDHLRDNMRGECGGRTRLSTTN